MYFEGGRLLTFHAGLELHSWEYSEGGGNCYCWTAALKLLRDAVPCC